MSLLLQKQGLNTKQLQLFETEMSQRRKSSGTAWLLLIFAGGLGGHRFYLGRTGTAVAMLLTLGGVGIWTLVDLFLLNGMISDTNDRIALSVLEEVRLMADAEARDLAARPPTTPVPADTGIDP